MHFVCASSVAPPVAPSHVRHLFSRRFFFRDIFSDKAAKDSQNTNHTFRLEQADRGHFS